MNRNLPAILVALLVIVAIVFTMCAFQVRFTESAVVTRFDEIQKVIEPAQAGLHFKLPWPIDQVNRYDTRLRVFNTEFRQLGTEDQKTIILTAYATWRIVDPRTFLKSVRREEAAQKKLADLLENRVSVVLRTHPLSNLVNLDTGKIRYAAIEAEFLDGIKDQALKNYGIEVVSVGIERLGIPESVTKDVFERMKQDRQKTIKELTAEGEAQAKQIRSSAEEVAGKILARAEAYAKTIEAQGEAEAAKYYREYSKNPGFAEFLKKRESLQKVLSGGQTTMVLDANEVELLKILKQGATAVQGGAAETSPKSGKGNQDDLRGQ